MFIWNNLAKEVKEQIVGPLKDSITEEQYEKVRDIKWYNLPQKLNYLFSVLKEVYDNCSEDIYPLFKFIWWNLPLELWRLHELKEGILNCTQTAEIITNNKSIVYYLSTQEVLEGNLNILNGDTINGEQVTKNNSIFYIVTETDVVSLDEDGNIIVNEEQELSLDLVITYRVESGGSFSESTVTITLYDILIRRILSIDSNPTCNNQEVLVTLEPDAESGCFHNLTEVTFGGEPINGFEVLSLKEVLLDLSNIAPDQTNNLNFNGYNPIPSTLTIHPLLEIAEITGGGSTACVGGTQLDFNNASVWASWSSSNEEVATIDPNGVVTALSAGTTIINAIAFDPTTGCSRFATNPQTITIYEPIALISSSKPNYSVVIEDGEALLEVEASGSVGSYQWQKSTNGVTFNTLTESSVFIGTQTATLQILNPPQTENNTYYRCLITGLGGCNSPITTEFSFLVVEEFSVVDPQDQDVCTTQSEVVFTTEVLGSQDYDTIIWEIFDGADWIVVEEQTTVVGNISFGGDVFSDTLVLQGVNSSNDGWAVRANVLRFDPETIVTSNAATINIITC